MRRTLGSHTVPSTPGTWAWHGTGTLAAELLRGDRITKHGLSEQPFKECVFITRNDFERDVSVQQMAVQNLSCKYIRVTDMQTLEPDAAESTAHGVADLQPRVEMKAATQLPKQRTAEYHGQAKNEDPEKLRGPD